MKLQSILRLFEHNLEFIVMLTRFLDAKLLYSAVALVWLLNLYFAFDSSLAKNVGLNERMIVSFSHWNNHNAELIIDILGLANSQKIKVTIVRILDGLVNPGSFDFL